MEDRELLVDQQCFEQVSSYTLPEHHSAMALLHGLDHAWFFSSVLRPRTSLVDAFLPSSSIPTPYSLSPFQSIELMDAAHSRWDSSSSPANGRGKLPCARIETSSDGIIESVSDSTKNIEIEFQQRPPADRTHYARRYIFSKSPVDTVLTASGVVQARVLDNHLRTSKERRAMKNPHSLTLESIQSGKELRVCLGDPPKPVAPQKNHRRNTKSMTSLEFDELQGFMDLGFRFSGDDLTPRIVSMFPALQCKAGEGGDLKKRPRAITSSKQRKSAYEAWLLHRSLAPLHRPRQVPTTSEDMKEHLKFWARAVASTVWQEC